MLLVRNVLCVCCVFVLLTSCKRSGTSSNSATPLPSPENSTRKLADVPNRESGPAKFDVCGLLKPEEIQARTGIVIKEQKSSGRPNGNLRISQCVYVAAELNKSVSVVVTQSNSPDGKEGARDFWEKTFSRYGEGPKKEEKSKRDTDNEKGEEREGRPPRRIKGLGEEAFWTAGSLYVLSKDAFIRVSIGGADAEEAKLDHSKALAVMALDRL